MRIRHITDVICFEFEGLTHMSFLATHVEDDVGLSLSQCCTV
jgi:hypothetical protein